MFYRESIGIIPSRRLTTKTMIRLHDVQADLRICYSRMAKDRFSHDVVTGYHAQAYTSYSRSRNSRFGIPYPLLAYIAYPTTHFTQAYDTSMTSAEMAYDTSMISAEMAINGSLYSR